MKEFIVMQTKLRIEEKMNLIQSAITTADIMDRYDPEVKAALIDWSTGKDVSAFEVDEVTVADMIDEYECTVFQALCMLNAIKQNPDAFDEALLMEFRDEIE